MALDVKDKSAGALEDNKKAQTAADVSSKLGQSIGETDAVSQVAGSRTKNLEEQQHATSDLSLNKNQRANYAKSGGQFGRFNNRDYATTLRLARAADQYNNKPIDHMFSVGTRNTGGIKDLGTGYDRPRIETMETRAMQQTQQLDTQQKAAAIALQDAVNHKDLDAYKQAYAQLYGIVLDDAAAKRSLVQTMRTQETMQILAQGMQYFQRAFGTETASVLYNMAQRDGGLYSNAVASVVANGFVAPAQQDMFAEGFIKEAAEQYQAKHHCSNEEALRNAREQYNQIIARFAHKSASANAHNPGIFGTIGDAFEGIFTLDQADRFK